MYIDPPFRIPIRLLPLLLAALFIAACSDSSEDADQPDAGIEFPVDTGTNAGPDGEADVQQHDAADVDTEADVEGEPDVESDAGCGDEECPPFPAGAVCEDDGECQSELCIASECISETAFVTRWALGIEYLDEGDDAEIPDDVDLAPITLPLEESGTYDFTVDWGDGTESSITDWDQDEATHIYDSPGVYTVIIDGELQGWSFDGEESAQSLVEIQHWGDLQLGNSGGYFRGASNLEISATDSPDLTETTNLRNAFRDCENIIIIPSIHDWDLSQVTDMGWMFWNASSFNQDISNWDVSNVESMSSLFGRASSFDQDISDWDVSNVTDMSGMFMAAESFDQDISNWDVSNVTDMWEMFWGARSFNQDISGWDVSSVETMEAMFEGGMHQSTMSFDQDLGDWDVSNVTNMSRMFHGATSFNGAIGSWNVSNVTDMSQMFQNAYQFDQDIGDWDVSNVTDMSQMFDAEQVSEPARFNQDISGWDVSSVTDMSQMFRGAPSFNQDLGGWDVSNVTAMSEMFLGGFLSRANYDSLLQGWSSLEVQMGVDFHAGNSRYWATSARQKLIDDYDWTITDGGEG